MEYYFILLQSCYIDRMALNRPLLATVVYTVDVQKVPHHLHLGVPARCKLPRHQ